MPHSGPVAGQAGGLAYDGGIATGLGDIAMTTATDDPIGLDHLPPMPADRRALGIGVVGAGFIVRDCHLVAYNEAGFRVVGITSRTRGTAEEVARLRGVPNVYDSVEELLANPEVAIVDVAVPPADQPAIIRR